MDEKERKELSEFFKKNPKVERLVKETREILRDLDKAIEDAPPDRPHPQPTPNGSLSPNSPGTQARTKGIFVAMKQKEVAAYEKKFDELTINYDEVTKGYHQQLSTKSMSDRGDMEKDNQTNKERINDQFAESKHDIQRGDVSKRIMDSLRSSRIGKGVDPERSKDKPEKDKSDKEPEPSKD